MDLDQEDIERSKTWAKWGCFLWAILLVLGPLLSIGGYLLYTTELKERPLFVSESPSRTNLIEVNEKGEPFFFGPSSIRIRFGHQHIDRTIYNDGKKLNGSNASVQWKDDYTAVVTLYGEEQEPETIELTLE
ncbi:hypothetical protein AF331_13355 [Rossellomorea marisflavi]|uniref:Uncharacterized protein n=1 Tax=Rossellomorea marisflavi TaxID=189381 RepID=A0A0M0G638_9BACI|nr:hypothetical protein AF331_13355 [Rossellomorea marisflavi]